nr:hypothetical protein [Micromonospora sp. DSM 115978]
MTKRIETVVLDTAGLSAWLVQDRKFTALLKIFNELESDIVVCANTIIEVCHARTDLARLN